MAQRGRFGRSETGASDLSQTIRSLVQQQLAAEEQMLFKSFYEGTPFGGSVPTYSDLVKFVNDRIGQGQVTDAQVAYYDVLLNQAQDFQTQKTYNDLKTAFYSTNGSNYEDISSFLQSDGSKFQEDLYGITKDYVTKFLYNDLATDQITQDEFMSRSQSALNAFVNDPFIYDDVKYDVYSSLYEYQLGEQQDILSRVNPSNDGAVLKANEGLLSFYKGWRTKLAENGIAGDFLDTVNNNIAKTSFAVQDQRRIVANKAAAALLNTRESAYNNARAVVDEYAKLLAPGLGIDASKSGFGFQDIPPVTLAAAIGDLSPEVQLQIRTAISDLRGKSDAYAQVLANQGKVDRARTIRDISTDAKLVSGQDISFERYVKQAELKDALMAAADGIPSDEIAVTKDWVAFLRGQTTRSFGAGLNPSTDRAGQEISLNIQNEANALDAALNGRSVGIVPKTYMDDFQSAQRAQMGIGGGAKDFYDKEFSGDNKYTAAELSNIAISLDLDKQISGGQTVIARKRNTDGTYSTDYIPAGVPAPSAGIIYKIEKTASGKIVTVAYKGTPIYGAIAGNIDTANPWGFAYETKGGTLYADAKDGKVYTVPPINVGNIKRSGAKDALITSDVDTKTIPGTYGQVVSNVKSSGTPVQASLSDYVDPGTLKSLENPGINPYAKVSPSDPRVTSAQGILANLKNIALGIPDSATDKSAITLAIGNIETNLNNLTGRSEDSGVRIAQMNAEIAQQKAAELKANIPNVPAIKPAPGPINPFSPVQPGGGETFGGGLDLSIVFRKLGELAGGIGAGAIQAGGALAYGIPSAVGGLLSAGINTILPGIPGATGAGATSNAPRPLAPVSQVKPLSITTPGGGAPAKTSVGPLGMSQQAFNTFRAGERAPLTSIPISTPKTTTQQVTPIGTRRNV